MLDFSPLAIFLIPIALLAQFLGKFFVASFMLEKPGDKRISSALQSTIACSVTTPIAGWMTQRIYVPIDDYFWLAVSVFFLLTASIDLVIHAPIKKATLKSLLLYLAVDYITALITGTFWLMTRSD